MKRQPVPHRAVAAGPLRRPVVGQVHQRRRRRRPGSAGPSDTAAWAAWIVHGLRLRRRGRHGQPQQGQAQPSDARRQPLSGVPRAEGRAASWGMGAASQRRLCRMAAAARRRQCALVPLPGPAPVATHRDPSPRLHARRQHAAWRTCAAPLDEHLRSIEARARRDASSRRDERFRIDGARARSRARAGAAAVRCTSARAQPIDGRGAAAGAGRGAARPPRGRRAAAADAERRIVLHTRRADLAGRTPNQVQYLRHMLTHDITFGIGPAGTGKTFLAVACAVDALERSTRAAHRAHAPGGRGRRAAGLPARRPGAEGRPLPAPAVRRAVRPDGLRPRDARPSRRACSRSRRWPSCAGAR